MDGRSRAAGARQAQAASGELRAETDGSGGGGGVAYVARGYKQGWAGERAEDGQADGSAILARIPKNRTYFV